MQTHRYVDPAAFLDRVQETLERDEAANNLPLGLLTRFAQDPERAQVERTPFFALVEQDGEVALVMVMTPPHNMIVCGAAACPGGAIDASVSFLLQEGVSLPGVLGPRDVAACFASAWGGRTGCAVAVQMEQMIYQLDRVNDVARCPGELIRATGDHVPLAAEWILGFSEVTPEDVSPEEARRNAEDLIEAERLYLWVDGEPMSMAWRARPTQHGIVISGVYTPPEQRSRGYATSCVASLSQLLLDQGYRFCSLYADLANPISNSIYQRIGYRPICASTMYSFAGTA